MTWYRCPDCRREHLGRTLLAKPPDSVCEDCYRARDAGAFESSRAIRCPACGYVAHDDLHETGIYTEGPHQVCCCACGHDYEVTTQIDVTWRSPPMHLQKGDSDA